MADEGGEHADRAVVGGVGQHVLRDAGGLQVRGGVGQVRRVVGGEHLEEPLVPGTSAERHQKVDETGDARHADHAADDERGNLV